MKYVVVPLFSDFYYTYSLSLEGESYNLEFLYNERAQQWFLNLLDADNNPVVMGVGVVPGYPILQEYAISGLTGFFWMEEKSNIITEGYKQYPEELNQYYNMFYIYE